MKVKMIWDFRGPNAEPIAGHHKIHLDDFTKIEGIENVLTGTEAVSDMHHIAFMVIDESLVPDLRARLKPNRGQRYDN